MPMRCTTKSWQSRVLTTLTDTQGAYRDSRGGEQCSPQHTKGMSALQAFSTYSSLMWERKEAKSFDVVTGHAQTTPSRHALNYSWGELWGGACLRT